MDTSTLGANGKKCVEVFGAELALIHQPHVRDFVIRIYDRLCPDGFWDRACSLSGKYHPRLSNGPGSLVRHVKYACWWGVALARAFDGDGRSDKEAKDENDRKLIEGPNRDYILAALIPHDMMKDGDPELAALPERQGWPGKSLINGCHGVDCCNAIWNRLLGQKFEFPEQELILMGIATHMGVWTKPEKYRPANMQKPLVKKICQIVHMADYAAAQKVDEYPGMIPTPST